MVVFSLQNRSQSWDLEPKRRLADEEILEAAMLSELLKGFVLIDDEDQRNGTLESLTSLLNMQMRS